MLKFSLLLSSLLGLLVLFSFVPAEKQKKGIEVNFSQSATGVESGQPVFDKSTQVTLTNHFNESIRLFINEKQVEIIANDKVEVANLTTLKEGTYNLVAERKNKTNDKVIVGFTLK